MSYYSSTQTAQSTPYLNSNVTPSLGTSQNVQDALDFLKGITITTTSAATLTLSNTSYSKQIFKGTVGGQVLKLPDATTLTQGTRYKIENTSSTIIPVYYNDGTTLFGSIYPNQDMEIIVYDITTTNGLWSKSNSIQNVAEQSVLFDDFIHAGTATNVIGNLGWTLTSTNGTATWALQSPTNARIGVGRLSTSNVNDGAGAIKLGTNLQTVLGGGIQMFETYVSIPTLGGAGAAAYVVRVGLGDTTGTGDEANGVYFEYNVSAAGTVNWSLKTASGSTRTTTNSGIAVSAGTWYKLSAVVNSAASSVAFYINNVFNNVITTNIPTTPIAPVLRIYSNATNAAAKSCDMDYYYFNKSFSTLR